MSYNNRQFNMERGMHYHEYRHEMKNPHFKKAVERISSLEAENRRMREALDLFWSESLAIETLARRAYGESSQIYQNVLAAILKAQEFYKNLPKATRAALGQED